MLGPITLLYDAESIDIYIKTGVLINRKHSINTHRQNGGKGGRLIRNMCKYSKIFVSSVAEEESERVLLSRAEQRRKEGSF